jgi:hypothetical protein
MPDILKDEAFAPELAKLAKDPPAGGLLPTEP